MSLDFDPHRVAAHPVIAGMVGAVIGLRFVPGHSVLGRLVNVLAGAATAGYITPAAAELFGLVTPALESALAFAVGMFGMSIAAALMQALRELPLAQIISGWLSRGKGGQR